MGDVLEDIKREENERKKKKERKNTEKNERRRVRRKERKFKDGYADMREWQRQLEKNAREGRIRQMRERKSRESKKENKSTVRSKTKVGGNEKTKTLKISKDQVRYDGQTDKTDKDQTDSETK